MDRLSDMQERIAAEMNGESVGEGGETPDADGNAKEEGENGEPAGGNGTQSEGAGNGEPQAQAAQDAGETEVLADGEAILADTISEEEVIDYLFEKHPDIKGIYATNGDAVKRALETLERNEAQASIIGFDADEEELDALRDGRVDALVLQNPFGMGYAAVIASARAALSMGNEAVVDTGYVWLTKESLEDEEIQKLLY